MKNKIVLGCFIAASMLAMPSCRIGSLVTGNSEEILNTETESQVGYFGHAFRKIVS